MTRIFDNCIEAVEEVKRDIMVRGLNVHPERMQNKDVKADASFDTKELLGYSLVVCHFNDRDRMLDYFKIPKSYCVKEMEHRLDVSRSAENPGVAYLDREELWKEFLDENGQFDYTYSARLHTLDQYKLVVELLRRDPNTRQGVLVIYDLINDTLHKGTKRIPCSMYYQFLIRRKKLVLIYNMRSCDFMSHFGADLWMARELQEKVASELSISAGEIQMFIGSLHVYKKYYADKDVF
jgi:thymidylate synthase